MAEPTWAKKFTEGVPPRFKDRKLVKEIRYRLFRLKSEADGIAKAEDLPRGFKKLYEEQEMFDGWENFGVTWDVGDPTKPEVEGDDPFTAIPLWTSIWEDWDEEMISNHKANEIAARKRRRTASGNQT